MAGWGPHVMQCFVGWPQHRAGASRASVSSALSWNPAERTSNPHFTYSPQYDVHPPHYRHQIKLDTTGRCLASVSIQHTCPLIRLRSIVTIKITEYRDDAGVKQAATGEFACWYPA
jgi:hypothetical protein